MGFNPRITRIRKIDLRNVVTRDVNDLYRVRHSAMFWRRQRFRRRRRSAGAPIPTTVAISATPAVLEGTRATNKRKCTLRRATTAALRASGRRFRNREIKARQRYARSDPEMTLRGVTHEFVPLTVIPGEKGCEIVARTNSLFLLALRRREKNLRWLVAILTRGND